tara:strand:- start:3852 stop:4196 length:345 start_codon:yes stop_codon:yes gene_type:complete
MKKGFRLLPDALQPEAKFQPWLSEKYGDSWDTPEYRKKRDEKEKDLKFQRDKMQHGPKKTGVSRDSQTYKDFKAKQKQSHTPPKRNADGVVGYHKGKKGRIRRGADGKTVFKPD